MRNGLLKVLILLDDTGIRELNDGKSVEGKSWNSKISLDCSVVDSLTEAVDTKRQLPRD